MGGILAVMDLRHGGAEAQTSFSPQPLTTPDIRDARRQTPGTQVLFVLARNSNLARRNDT